MICPVGATPVSCRQRRWSGSAPKGSARRKLPGNNLLPAGIAKLRTRTGASAVMPRRAGERPRCQTRGMTPNLLLPPSF